MNPVHRPQLVVPAVIPESAPHLATVMRTLAFAHEVHVDVVDGAFVTSVSWPYDPVGEPTAQQHCFAGHTVEVDLMVQDPLPAAEAWVAAGAQMVVFHVETIALTALERFVTEHDEVSVGVSALNGTDWNVLRSYLSVADYVQVMGIGTIGAQGAPLDERALERIATIDAEYPDILISVDGSVNPDTAARFRDAGANRYIAGSAILRAEDPLQAYEQLQSLVRPQRRD